MAAPKFGLDGNQIVRIMLLAFAVERKTYQHRAKGAHRGALGAVSIELLRALIWFGRKYGQIYPSLEKLAVTLRKCGDTIATALARLVDQGFVTKHRRSRLIRTSEGERRRQDSNAYEVHMPGDNVGAARIPGLIPPLVSDPKISDVPVDKTADIKPTGDSCGSNDGRFWKAAPYRMPNGSWT
jgi:hypothetical protein